MKRNQQNNSMDRQRGAALLILAVVLILTVVIIMVGKNSRNADKLQREENVTKRLADAKEAMISIAVANSVLSGVLLYPDRAGGGGFDGGDDCHGGFNPQTTPGLLMGRLPFIGNGAGGCAASVPTSLDIGQSMNPNEDARPLHYVISQNLVEFTAVGPPALANTINANVVTEGDGWLTVYDGNGNIIGANVAFIIFYPGAALPGQDRTLPVADAAEYLESFTVPIIGLVDNADPPAITPAPSNYVAAAESATFNDKLVFVTANDLMRRVELAMLNRIAVQLAADFNPVVFPVDQAALVAVAPYNAAPFSHWLVTQNTYDDDDGNPLVIDGYPFSVTYSTTALLCNGVPFTGAVVIGIPELGDQCAGAN